MCAGVIWAGEGKGRGGGLGCSSVGPSRSLHAYFLPRGGAKVATMLCSKKTQYEHSASDQLNSCHPHTHVTPASLGVVTHPSFQTTTEHCRGF